MRHLFTFILLFSASLIFAQNDSYVDSIQELRKIKDVKYLTGEDSPLLEEDQKKEKGLNYFVINPNYAVEAQYKLVKRSRKFKMKTSTERLPEYKKFASVTFQLPGKNKKYELFLYQNIDFVKNKEYKNHLFLPFIDLTSGEQSYGGGRYLDLEQPKKGVKTLMLDFNLLYNPYCSYNHRYSCPIPPLENFLDYLLEAGEKVYSEDH